MSKTANIVAALALATLVPPASAGSWPNLPARGAPATGASSLFIAVPPQSRDGFVADQGDSLASPEQYSYYLRTPENEKRFAADGAAKDKPAPRVAARVRDGFEYIGGEGGWQLVSHKYEWKAGALAHSDECDHAIRVVKAPTPAEIEATRALYPG